MHNQIYTNIFYSDFRYISVLYFTKIGNRERNGYVKWKRDIKPYKKEVLKARNLKLKTMYNAY